jgi:hypothetical protein
VLIASPGSWSFKVVAAGYRESTPLSVTIAADETKDVGRVLLEPHRSRRVQLVQRDGTPAGAGWQIEFLDLTDSGNTITFSGFELVTDEGGVVVLRRELPERFLLRVWRPGAEFLGPDLPVLFELQPWPQDETRDLVVPPLVRASVVLDLAAIDSDLRDASCGLSVRSADGPEPQHSIGGRAIESAVPLEGRRLFRFSAPPGRYVLRAGGPLFGAPETTVELADTSEPQEFTLVAEPR